ncbi:Hypothetical predicted protein, partial [Marmota monax]
AGLPSAHGSLEPEGRNGGVREKRLGWIAEPAPSSPAVSTIGQCSLHYALLVGHGCRPRPL